MPNQCGYPADPSKHGTYDTRTNAMYRLVVLFLTYTGARFGQMVALMVARLDLRRNRAMIAAFLQTFGVAAKAIGVADLHRTSSGTPQQASPSRAVPTSRLSSRCSVTHRPR